MLLVNVVEMLSSPAPARDRAPDCIPIVGLVKPLVPSDKRFNHTKVWCTFIFIIYIYSVCGTGTGDCCCMNECYNIVVVVKVATAVL